MRAAYAQGLCLYNVCYLSFSHGDDDIDDALGRFARVADDLAGDA